MEVLFLIGSVQAVFLSLLVFNKKSKTNADYVLGIWMIFIGFHLLYYYLRTIGFMETHPHLLGIGFAFPQLQAPFMFVYVLLVISKTGKFKTVYLLHGLSFFITTIYLCFDFYFLSGAEKLAYYNLIYTDLPLDVEIIAFPNIIISPIYIIWSLFKLSQHSKNIAREFSYTEKIDLKWLKILIGVLGFIAITVIVSNILVQFPFLSIEMHDHLNYIAVTFAVFYIGYFGIKQQAIYTNSVVQNSVVPQQKTIKKKNTGERYLHSGLKKDEAEKHLKELKTYFEKDKPFLNGKLSLPEIATKLEISQNHLSQVINEQLGMSFYDYVNRYRVEEVKTRLSNSENEQFTLLAIAYDSGFNSKSSFNAIFKKFTGSTPSQFINQARA